MNKRKTLSLLSVLSLAILTSCGTNTADGQTHGTNNTNVSVSAEEASNVDLSSVVTWDSSDDDFTITTSDGTYTVDNSVYTISTSGTYELTGKLHGQIYVNVPESDTGEVVLTLNGADITYDQNSPVYIASAEEVEVKAQKGTTNTITDTRAEETTEDDTQGGGALYAKADLKLKGKGKLTVTGSYNNGVHTSKDLDIKNMELVATAPNNAIKGNNSVEVHSGSITAVSTGGDGLKTEDSDVSSSGNQKGDINIFGGTLNIYAAGDGLDAAHDVDIYDGVDEDDATVTTVPEINIYTAKFSSYTTSSTTTNVTNASVLYAPGGNMGGGGMPGGGMPGGPGGNMGGGGMSGGSNAEKSDTSAKGIKAANIITIEGGVTNIKAYDDGIHANYGTALENGKTGLGDVYMKGGTTTIYATDDGIHADRYLNISGGTNEVTYSYEGIEATGINISGGHTVATATDDGANASSSSISGVSSSINVTGGFLQVNVPSSGDVDGIDANGTYKQTGGVVIATGPSSEMAAALDVDGSISITGGTTVAFGYMSASSSLTKTSKSGSYSAKTYKLSFSKSSDTYEFTLKYTYSGMTAFSASGTVTVA